MRPFRVSSARVVMWFPPWLVRVGWLRSADRRCGRKYPGDDEGLQKHQGDDDDQENHRILQGLPEDVRLMAHQAHGGAGYGDGLGGDQLAHDTTEEVGRSGQDWVQPQVYGRDLLKLAEEGRRR